MSERKQLFFGDNLRVLRNSIAAASVDLIYLDPLFDSQRDDKLLFKTPKPPGALETGQRAGGSVTAAAAESGSRKAQQAGLDFQAGASKPRDHRAPRREPKP